LRPTPEVDQRLRGLPDEIRLLLTEEEGCTLLSPAGEAFYEAYHDRLAQAATVPLLLSVQAWEAYRAAPPSTQRLFARTLNKLQMRELRLSGSDQVHNCDCRVFPKGHRTERLFYFETEDGQCARVRTRPP
jgi:hypothetical protein